VIALVTLLSFWLQSPADPTTTPAPPAAPDSTVGEYVLGPRDLLEIRVLEVPELNLERRVSERGTIDLPLLGDFDVTGLTAMQLRERLETTLLARFVNRANVSVVIKEFSNKPVSIVGAVLRPGSLNISGRWTLLQAIAAAGGLSGAAGKKIYVLRSANNGLTDTLEVPTDELFQSGSPMWNIPIFPSDVVNVPPRQPVTVFCIGEVKTPGAQQFDVGDRISLLTALAKAGGVTDRASSSVRIRRRGTDGRDTEIRYDYKRILAGKDPDPELLPGDVILVKESFF
jgi:polysaccharide export outer membrane protein